MGKYKFRVTKQISCMASGNIFIQANSKQEALMIINELTNSELDERSDFDDLNTDYDSFSGLTIYDGNDIISRP